MMKCQLAAAARGLLLDEDGHARADVEFGDRQPNIIIDSEGNIVGRYRATRGGLY